MTPPLPLVRIFTDGGCKPNPGPGGWGAVLLEPGEEPRELSGSERATTNNRMELTAAIEALRALDGPHRVELVTDSEYLKKGVTEWLPGWQRRNWRTAAGGEVQNQDLWQALTAELGRHRVSWRWTRGHTGDRFNERADQLASAAIPGGHLPLDDRSAVHLFAAAAYSGRDRAGSWAVVLRCRERERTLAERVEDASANRMHLLAAVAGLEALTRPSRVHVYTASDYVHDGATRWLPGWKARGFMTRDDKPVSHRDLWLRLDRQIQRHQAEWHVVDSDEPPEGLALAKQLARRAVKGEGAGSGD